MKERTHAILLWLAGIGGAIVALQFSVSILVQLAVSAYVWPMLGVALLLAGVLALLHFVTRKPEPAA